ncbi:MAG: 4-oxalocrotonate tautomerase [Oscillospiraceae bacterium]|nr:4-oxalocrotonate tautomerase [Oscillospiraceae bacterium]
MEPTKNLCAQIPVSLHAKVREEQERSGQPLSAYITQVLTSYYERGEKSMEYTKTLAFQIPEELFYRIKDHLAREKERTGKKLSQRDFVLGLIERALEEAEAQEAAPQDEPQEGADGQEEVDGDADLV